MQPKQNPNPTPGWVTMVGTDGVQPISAKVEIEPETNTKYITVFWELSEEDLLNIQMGHKIIALTTLHGLPPHRLQLVETIE